MTPEHFAQSLVEDYGLAPTYFGVIIKSMNDQLNDYKAHSARFDADGIELPLSSLEEKDSALCQPIRGTQCEEDVLWWSAFRKRKLSAPTVGTTTTRKRRRIIKDEDEDEEDDWVTRVPIDVDGLKDEDGVVGDSDEEDSGMRDDMRILIKVCLHGLWLRGKN